MSKEIQVAQKVDPKIMEQVLVSGDLSKLSVEQRLSYYDSVCTSLGLNPMTKPFGYISLNGKLTLYALRDCTDQIRSKRGVSVTSLDGKVVDDLYIVTATGKDKDGRVDCATGAVNIKSTVGEGRANAIMKAETKAKRRLTLSLCGLGWLDESEVSSVPDAKIVDDSSINVSTSSSSKPVEVLKPEVVNDKKEPAPKSAFQKTQENVKKLLALPPEILDALRARGMKQNSAIEYCEKKDWDTSAIRHELALDVEQSGNTTEEIPFE